jgi:hypothetical protein
MVVNDRCSTPTTCPSTVFDPPATVEMPYAIKNTTEAASNPVINNRIGFIVEDYQFSDGKQIRIKHPHPLLTATSFAEITSKLKNLVISARFFVAIHRISSGELDYQLWAGDIVDDDA